MSRVEKTTRAIACVGNTFSDTMNIITILRALSQSSGYFISALESVPRDKQTVNNVTADSSVFMTHKNYKMGARCRVF